MRIKFSILYFLFHITTIFATEISQTGVILDNQGVPLINANVHEQDMANAVKSKLYIDEVVYGYTIIVIHESNVI